MRPEVDAELLKRLDQRDVRGAAALLIEGHADAVVGLCRAMVRDVTVAEDLSQDVFSNAFRALASFRGEASPRTWILRIARNRCVDYLRAVRRRPFIDDDASTDEQPNADPTVDDLIMRREDVQRGLDALAENERALVMLRFGHELGYGELATTFGLSEGATRMRISRAVAKMREAIATPEAARGGRSASAAPEAELADLAEAPATMPAPAPDSAPPPPSIPPPARAPAPPAAAAPPPLGSPAPIPRAPAPAPSAPPVMGSVPRQAPPPLGAPRLGGPDTQPPGAPAAPESSSPFGTVASDALVGRLRDLVSAL